MHGRTEMIVYRSKLTHLPSLEFSLAGITGLPARAASPQQEQQRRRTLALSASRPMWPHRKLLSVLRIGPPKLVLVEGGSQLLQIPRPFGTGPCRRWSVCYPVCTRAVDRRSCLHRSSSPPRWTIGKPWGTDHRQATLALARQAQSASGRLHLTTTRANRSVTASPFPVPQQPAVSESQNPR